MRWAFYATALSCLILAAQKFLGLEWPRAFLVAGLAAVPLGRAAREWIRRMTIRECAVLVDRECRLEERVASAVEAAGPMAAALAGDASRALRRSEAGSLGRVRWPREMPFLLVAALVAMILWALPSPDAGGASVDPALLGTAHGERERWLGAMKIAPQAGEEARPLSEVVELLDRGTPEAIREAIERLRRIEERSAQRLLDRSLSAEEAASWRALAERAGASGAALGMALQRSGEAVPLQGVSPSLAKKLERAGLEGGMHAAGRPSDILAMEAASGGGVSPVQVRDSIAKTLEKKDWPPRYNAAVTRYFTGD